jgi:hypothetical protein
MGKLLADRHPQGRVFVSGGVRFRLNSWFDLQQVGGAFETGLTNRVPVELAYRVRSEGRSADEILMYLKAVGTEYVAVHGEKSKEYYRDFRRPDRLGSLPVVYREDDDAVYAVPARPLAHLVSESELPDQDVLEHPDSMRKYVMGREDAARPALRVAWQGVSRLAINGPVRAGDLVAVQVNAAEGWKATQDGREVPLTADRLGFVVVHPSPAAQTRIELAFHGTAEQRLMATLGAIAWIGAIAVRIRARRRPAAF